MSDTQATPETEAITKTIDTATVETPVDAIPSATIDAPRGDRGARPGDRKGGPRRDNGRGGIREEAKEFKEEMLEIARVTRVTAGGRQLRFRASIVIGDGKGRVGLGIGKSGEVQGAIEKAIRDAKKNLVSFNIVNGTIAHDVSINFKSSSLFLHPAHPGTGIIAGGAVRKICSVSGLKDVIAKQHGSSNPITNARVAMKAFSALKPVSQIRSFAKAPATTTEIPSTPTTKSPVAKKENVAIPVEEAKKTLAKTVVKTPAAKKVTTPKAAK
ncbi:30S ribosomal protein S5 [Candidatus Gracilibacteria bacterium]|nr:30S ribosomal protein S5 [Candidatus Gracilibacteria bacterium]